MDTKGQEITNKSRKSSRGRPALLECERRIGRIQVGFNLSEYRTISEKSQALGISESEYVRAAVLNRPLKSVSEINKETYFELKKIGTNINQIALILNAHGNVKSFDSLNRLNEKINEVRKQLLGVE